eukprot:1336204-Amphidinium_carterae.1
MSDSHASADFSWPCKRATCHLLRLRQANCHVLRLRRFTSDSSRGGSLSPCIGTHPLPFYPDAQPTPNMLKHGDGSWKSALDTEEDNV